jgi:hypothetical protein
MKSISQLKLQEELERVLDSPFMNRTDAQIDGQIKLSELYQDRYQGAQPSSLEKYNDPEYRNCKLTMDQALEIRQKYVLGEYGKKRLAAEYGVSKSVITRILNNQSWRQK